MHFNIQKSIFLTRHGATAYNDESLLQGWIDIPLSDKGKREAGQLSEILKDEHFDIIFHSPLSRTRQTAEIINTHHQSQYGVIDSFIEMDLGDWEGQPLPEMIKKHPGIYYQWVSDPDTVIPGGESFTRVFNRVKPGVEEVLASPYKDILIVAHAMVNRAILGHLMGIEPGCARRFRMENCAFSKFLVIETPQGPRVLADTWNNYSHLNIP